MSLRFSVTRTDHPLPADRREEILANPGFGRYFTDHMVLVDWTEEQGWHDPRVVPYGPFTMDPATMVLHYAQEIFEGLKVYRQPDGGVATFRPTGQRRSAEPLGRPTRHAPADRRPVRRVHP